MTNERARRSLIICGTCALLAITPTAWAEWTTIYEDEGTVGYIDPTTIKSVGNDLRRVAELLDFKKPDPQFKGELSHRFLVEYDCKNRRVRIVSVTGHAERMGQGRITNSAEPKPNWSPIDSRSNHVRQLRIVCAS